MVDWRLRVRVAGDEVGSLLDETGRGEVRGQVRVGSDISCTRAIQI